MMLNETVQEDIKEYLKNHENEIMKDSLFDIVGSFQTKEGNWSEKDDWRE
jgi:hypothetical protein